MNKHFFHMASLVLVEAPVSTGADFLTRKKGYTESGAIKAAINICIKIIKSK